MPVKPAARRDLAICRAAGHISRKEDTMDNQTADEAELSLAEATLAAEHAAERVRQAVANQITARKNLANEIEAWRNVWPKLTFLENIRQFQARSLAERAAAVDAPAPAPTPCADSAIDRIAKYSKGGQVQARHNSFRRGGHDISSYGQRVKLPSDR
jgi:hypothetical protein